MFLDIICFISGMPRTLCTPGTGMTMTDTDSGWSSPRGEEAASEEGGQKEEEAEVGEAPRPGGASTGSPSLVCPPPAAGRTSRTT